MSGGEAFTHDIHYTLSAIWRVMLASLVLGAGLPAIFALGIRSLAWGSGGQAVEAEGSGQAGGGQVAQSSGNPAGRILAGILFLIVLYGVAAGIIFIIATGQGKDISFTHVIPTIH